MKLLFFALLAIAATAESLQCEPNSVFNVDCNTCRCSPDGKHAACTLKGCVSLDILNRTRKSRSIEVPKSKESEQTCEPGTTFKDYCNTCKCGDDGKVGVCTYMYCDPAVWNKDGTFKTYDSEESSVEESKQICEPGTTFRNYCNTCRCSNDGKNAACTLMACDPAVWNKDGSRKTRSIVPEADEHEYDCEPHKTFKYYCNTCTCRANGKIGACTLMYCDPAIWNRDGTRKTVEPAIFEEPKQYCEPGTNFMDYCNSCRCSKDGRTAACTLMACDPRVWNKDGTKKISSHHVKSDEFEV